MSDAVKTLGQARYRDIQDAPPDVIAEIVNGELYMQARPAQVHIEAAAGLTELLRPPFQRGRGGPGGWWICPEPEIDFGNPEWRTLVPDLAGWRKERVPTLPVAKFTIVPDWVCEVLSPSTRLHDRNTKAKVYAEEGVAYMWLIDPAHRLLEAYENVAGDWREVARYEVDGSVGAAPFADVPFALSDLWPPE